MRLLTFSLFSIILIVLFATNTMAQFVFTKSIIDTAFLTNWPTNVRSADFDLNGTTDLVVTVPDFSGDMERIYIYKSNGEGLYTRSILDSSINNPGRISVADIDGNDYPDFVLTSADGIIRYSSDDGFNTWSKSPVDEGLTGYRLSYIADLDKDLDTDVVFLANQGVYWADNDGSENFTRQEIELISIADDALAVFDIDNDDDNDVFVTIYGDPESTFGWYENNGSESFIFNEINTINNNFMAMIIADLDNDDDMDLITCETRDPNLLHAVYWYDNNGSHNFTKKTIGLDFDIYPRDLYALDFDYDGYKDVMVTGGNNANGELVIYKNDGAEKFEKITLDGSPGNRQNLDLADTDNDGDLDVFVMNTWPFQLEYFENNTPTPLERDSLALVALYNSTAGENWTFNTNWLSAQPISTWLGISVINGVVEGITLNQNNLVGEVPPEIGNLKNLIDLQLMNNQLEGSIPAAIGSLPNLHSLYLLNNNISGSIPKEIGKLANLSALSIARNNLTGALPPEIGNISNLQLLLLSDNQLDGEIPVEIGQMDSLEHIELHKNNLAGDFPSSVTGLSNLKDIYLFDNQISGFPDLSTLTGLNNLIVFNNRLTFEDIEPNIGIPGEEFIYAPQDSVGEKIDTTVFIGENFMYSVNVGGSANQYQWYKDGEILEGSTANFQVIFNVTPEFAGSYHCEITNTLATDLTLISRPINLTVPTPPLSVTDTASNITTTSVTLNGTVDSKGITTNVNFLWGLNSDLSDATITAAEQSPVSGSNEISVSLNLSDLQPETTYYFKVQAMNGLGTTEGSIKSFTTLQEGVAPTVTTLDATNINSSLAQLNGIVNPNGLETTVEFEIKDFSSITASQSPISGTSNQNVNGPVSGLSPGTQYQYRVYATNSTATTYGDWITFTTLFDTGITVETTFPDNVTYNSATLTGTINPNNLNPTAFFQWGPDQSYGNTVAADQGSLSGAEGITVTTDLTDLVENTAYHYRVIAVDGSDTTFGQNQPFGTLFGPVILNSPGDGSTELTINGTLAWNAKSAASQYQIQIATDNVFSNPLIDDTTSQIWYDVLLAFGTTYYWRVAVFETGIIHTWSDVWSLVTEHFPTEIITSTSLSFPSHNNSSDYLPTDYRLFGLPGNANSALADILGSNSNSEWTAYWDNGQNGNPQDYLEKYKVSNTFRFVTGRAFWLIYKGTLQINQTVDNVSLTNGNEAEFPVHSGWNVITNPFLTTINWDEVRTLNSISEPLHAFDGSFSETSSMEPYKGYYFFNDPGLGMATIIVPVSSLFEKPAKDLQPISDTYWSTTIKMKTNDSIISSIKIGIVESASESRDKFEYHKPRANGEIPGIYFERKNWDEKYPFFANDLRASFNDISLWSFKINAAGRQNIELTIADLEHVPQKYDIFIIDHTRAKFLNMREKNKYTFNGIPNLSSFDLLVGDKDKISEKLQNILPKDFSVEASFPNPFNPVTTIPVLVPETTKLSITIYDVTGRDVKHLFNGYVDPGKHFFSWDGTDNNRKPASSGIYIFRIQNFKNKAYSGKLILLK